MGDRTWYQKLGARTEEPTGTVQLGEQMRRSNSWRLPEHVLRLAQAEYQHQYGNGQDYETMQARMGALRDRGDSAARRPRRAPRGQADQATSGAGQRPRGTDPMTYERLPEWFWHPDHGLYGHEEPARPGDRQLYARVDGPDSEPHTETLWEGPSEPIPARVTGPSPDDASQLVVFMNRPPGTRVRVVRANTKES